MRPYKQFVLIGALAAVAFVGSAASGAAQHRGGGRGRGVVVGGGLYSPFYDPFFLADPWYGGYQYPYPYPPGRPYGYGYRRDEPEASVRLEVKPKQAEVFVDGYYAGVVDDFDGTFQRLRVEPGEHEIALWLDGYKTVRQKVYLTQDNTFRVKYQMERLAAGQAPEPKPQPIDPPEGGNRPQPGNPPRAGQPRPMPPPMDRGPVGRRMPPPDDPRGAPDNPRPRQGQGNAAYGTLSIKVQPGDADVSIDGENWRGPGGQDRLTVEVAEGSHTVEIRKAGYRNYVTQVDVRRGQTTPLNVSLRGEQ